MCSGIKSTVLQQSRDLRWIAYYETEHTCLCKMCLLTKRLNSLRFQKTSVHQVLKGKLLLQRNCCFKPEVFWLESCGWLFQGCFKIYTRQPAPAESEITTQESTSSLTGDSSSSSATIFKEMLIRTRKSEAEGHNVNRSLPISCVTRAYKRKAE